MKRNRITKRCGPTASPEQGLIAPAGSGLTPAIACATPVLGYGRASSPCGKSGVLYVLSEVVRIRRFRFGPPGRYYLAYPIIARGPGRPLSAIRRDRGFPEAGACPMAT